MMLQEAVRVRLSELIKEKDYPAYRLCKEGGVPRAAISQILSGKNGRIKPDTLYQRLVTMDVPLAEFFTSVYFVDLMD